MILVIDDKVPEYDKHAGAVTLFQYLNLMVELGLKVIFHPQDGQKLQPYTQALQRRGIEIVHAPDTLADWLAENGRHVDFVWTARPYVTFPILDLIKRSTGAPILYYTHDLHYLRELRRYELDGNGVGARGIRAPQADGARHLRRRRHRDDAEHRGGADHRARRCPTPAWPWCRPTCSPTPTRSIPPRSISRHDATCCSWAASITRRTSTPRSGWCATSCRGCGRRAPDTRAMIVGHAPPAEVRALADDRVEVTGFVPSIDPYFARARASVSPLRYGAGVKGKIVSALQAGIPVVTTGCGNEGIQLRHGVEALVGETAADIADAVLRLLGDAPLCRELSQAGAAVVRERFSATRARRVLRRLLGDDLCPLCGTRPRHPQPAAGAAWGDGLACMTCQARNRDAALGRAILAPFGRYGVSSLREALPLLADLRLQAVGIADAVARELAALPGFGCGDTAAVADGSIDLLISLDRPVDVAEARRVVRPGGRHVFGMPAASDTVVGQLRADGFAATLHTDEEVARPVVVEATRMG